MPTSSELTSPQLRWFADADGVHRLRQREGVYTKEQYRAAVSTLTDTLRPHSTAWVWIAWSQLDLFQAKEGKMDTLEDAKRAAEEALKELDGAEATTP